MCIHLASSHLNSSISMQSQYTVASNNLYIHFNIRKCLCIIQKGCNDLQCARYITKRRGGVTQWVARLARNVEVVGSLSKELFPYCEL